MAKASGLLRCAVAGSAVGALAVLAACSGKSGGDGADGSTGETGTGVTTTTFTTTSASATSTSAGESSSGGFDTGSMGGECSMWEQDCPDGEKCVPWSQYPDLVPDDIRCCLEVDNPKLPHEECTVQDYFGSCLDDCIEGSLCMDIDGDGTGVCQPFCTGSAEDPMCEFDESCLFYFAGVPLCFPVCDPLIQDCLPGEGCYPDEEAAGGTGFICLPTVGEEQMVGDTCWLLSNCEPGLLCVTASFFPGCDAPVGCCTQICDISMPDPCPALDPALACVSWYYAGQMPPDPQWQNVGACVIPP